MPVSHVHICTATMVPDLPQNLNECEKKSEDAEKNLNLTTKIVLLYRNLYQIQSQKNSNFESVHLNFTRFHEKNLTDSDKIYIKGRYGITQPWLQCTIIWHNIWGDNKCWIWNPSKVPWWVFFWVQWQLWNQLLKLWSRKDCYQNSHAIDPPTIWTSESNPTDVIIFSVPKSALQASKMNHTKIK